MNKEDSLFNLKKTLHSMNELINEIYKFVDELNINNNYKEIVFRLILERVIRDYFSHYEGIKHFAPVKKIKGLSTIELKKSSDITFSEYIANFSQDRIKFHYQRVVILAGYLQEIKGENIVTDLLDKIKEYFPTVFWKIPTNLKRDTAVACKRGYIVCKNMAKLSNCYLTQKGIQLLKELKLT